MASTTNDITKILETNLSASEKNAERLNDTLLRINEQLQSLNKNGGTREFRDYLTNSFDKINDYLSALNEFRQQNEEKLKEISGGAPYQIELAKYASELKLFIANVLSNIDVLNEKKQKTELHFDETYNRREALELEKTNGNQTQERINELNAEIDRLNKIIDRDAEELHRIEIVVEDKWNSIKESVEGFHKKFGDGSPNSDAVQMTSGLTRSNLEDKSSRDPEIKQAQELNHKRQETETLNEKEIFRLRRENNLAMEKRLRTYDAVIKSISKIWGQVKQGGSYWLKYNEQAISDAKRLGMSLKSAYAYQTAMMQTSKELARNFGMTADQAMKMQQSFFEATGKATLLSKSQMEDVAAASKILGTESVASAIKIMDNMGSTAGEAVELMDRTYQRAANSGFDTVQMSKKFVENMSLANKLTFRSGVDGISRMTLLSERMKFNLQNVASVADKFSSIEGAINGSAQMQMLGGQYASSFGNPMAVLYESMANPEALYKRMLKTFSTQAVFNKETGEAEIDPYQLQLMKEAAKAIGVNPDEAVSSAKAQVKNKEIDAVIARNFNLKGIKEEDKVHLENMAQFNKETGTWNVSYTGLDGEKRTIDINSLSARDMKEIMRDNVDPVMDIKEHVRKIASELVGTKERWTSMKEQWRTGLSQMINKPMQWGSNALSELNGSSIWGSLTGGGGTQALGVLGIGVGAGLNAYYSKGILKAIRQGMTGGFGNRVSSSSEFTTPSSTGTSLNNGSTGAARPSGPKSKWYNKLTTKSPKWMKIGKGVGAGASILSGFYVGYQGYTTAEKQLASSISEIDEREKNGELNNFEARRERIIKKNEAHKAKSGAIGEGIGVAGGGWAGAAIGMAIGGPIGALIGGVAGGILGSASGKALGETIGEGGKGNGDTVANIDYNVSVISRQLGAIGSVLSNGGIDFSTVSETGFITDKYISADKVRIVDNAITCARVAPTDSSNSSSSTASNSPSQISLNIDGTIKLDCGKFMVDMPKDKLRDMIMKSGLLDEIVGQVSKGQQLAYSGCKTTTDTTGRPNVQYKTV